MNSVEYKFDTLCPGSDKDHIFQFIKDRKLSEIYHSHDFYELICVLHGRATQIVNEQKTVTEEKKVMLLFPGDRHCFVGQSDDVEIISLSVRSKTFELLTDVYGVSFDEHPVTFDFLRISKLYDIYRENRNIAEVDFKLLLSTILHAYAHSKNISTPDNVPEALSFAAEEMKKTENLREGISAFVSLSNYSQSHLSRLVQKHFDMGLKQYVNELRLLRAYDDFIWTNESAESISENLGFSSYSHFYKIFKERFSITPSSLRKGK